MPELAINMPKSEIIKGNSGYVLFVIVLESVYEKIRNIFIAFAIVIAYSK